MTIHSTRVPAGTYWVGDPCYAFSHLPHEDWMAWLEAARYDQSGREWLLEAPIPSSPEHRAIGLGTLYGDGKYPSREGGFSFPVDAGLIGVVSVGFTGDVEPAGMTKVTFDHDFEVSVSTDEDGLIKIDDIDVITGDDPDACPDCGESMDWCACDEACWTCGETPMYCECCDECGESAFECTCYDDEEEEEEEDEER